MKADMADFDYGNARLHVMKAKLLTNRQLEEMAGMESFPGVISALMKTAYQPAIEYAITRTAGIEIILQALRQDLLYTVRKTRTFFRHEAGEMVLWLLRRYDIHNLKAVLRGLGKHIAPAEIAAALLPVGDLEESTLLELAMAASPRDATDMLASMNLPFSRPLLKLRAEHPGADTLEMETALEGWYYREAGLDIDENRDKTGAGGLFFEALALDADVTNLLTTLRFIHAPAERKILHTWAVQALPAGRQVESEAFRHLLVGPGSLPLTLFERMVNQDDIANALKLLENTAYASSLEAGLYNYQQSSRLSDLEKSLRHYRLHWMARQIPNDPLGIGVFLGYLALKINEISNLAWIAQGIQAGMKSAAIRAEMELLQ